MIQGLCLSSFRFQSTPPYKRATVLRYVKGLKYKVSIHAPVQAGDHRTPPYKRATIESGGKCPSYKVSIHAPVQAGDLLGLMQGVPYSVSIHAPVQAGDLIAFKMLCFQCLFQSTPPYKRATVIIMMSITHYAVFQSTPPYKRATVAKQDNGHQGRGFNPRPRTSGRLVESPDRDIAKIVSIHAPVQAGDLPQRNIPPTRRVSIHAPVQAGDK